MKTVLSLFVILLAFASAHRGGDEDLKKVMAKSNIFRCCNLLAYEETSVRQKHFDVHFLISVLKDFNLTQLDDCVTNKRHLYAYFKGIDIDRCGNHIQDIVDEIYDSIQNNSRP